MHKSAIRFLCSTTSRKLTLPLIPTGRGKKRTLIRKLFYFCSFAQIHQPVFVRYSVLNYPFTITHWEADFVTPFEKKIFPSHLYLMGEVIFEVFFETFSKSLHLFGMGRGILQPQTKIFSSLVHTKMYSIKKYPLTLNAKKAREI